ncbi:MAG TPA: hypothetical protein VLH39_05165 [Magnetospirillaceae bacterium]|nr:hypothetical protein [Magnetospirillaceae bacterium]
MTFSEKLKQIVNSGLDTSRDIVSKAGGKAQQWGEMGVVRVEILQLRAQAEKLTARLGAEVYEVLVEKGQKTVSRETPAVREVLERISELETGISAKEAQFRKLGGKDEELDKV